MLFVQHVVVLLVIEPLAQINLNCKKNLLTICPCFGVRLWITELFHSNSHNVRNTS